MAENFKTELVVRALTAGNGQQQPAELQKLIEQMAGAMGLAANRSAQPKIAMASAAQQAQIADFAQKVINHIAGMTGRRGSEELRFTSAPFATGRKVMRNGEEVDEMTTATYKMRVKSSPHAHMSQARLDSQWDRMTLKAGLSSAQRMPADVIQKAIAVMGTASATEEEVFAAKAVLAEDQAAQRQEKRDAAARAREEKAQRAEGVRQAKRVISGTRRTERLGAARYKAQLGASEKLARLDPETGLAREPMLMEGDVQRAMETLATTDDPRERAHAQSIVGREQTRRKFIGGQTSKDRKLTQDVSLIERDVDSLRQRLASARNLERVSAADTKLDATIRAFYGMTPKQRTGEEGRTQLNDIRRQAQDVTRAYSDAEREQETADRLANRGRAGMFRGLGRAAIDYSGTLYDRDKSIMTSGAGGVLQMGGQFMQMHAMQGMMAGMPGAGGMFLAATAGLMAMNAVSSMHDRGAQMRDMANQLDMTGQPVFVRERMQRNAMGATMSTDVPYNELDYGSTESLRAIRDSSLNDRAQKLADFYGYDRDEVKRELSANRQVVSPANAPENYRLKQVRAPQIPEIGGWDRGRVPMTEAQMLKTVKKVENDELQARAKVQQAKQGETLSRLREIEAELPFFSPQEGMQKVNQLRNMSGAVAPPTRYLAQAVRTGTLAGLPPELLGAALRAGQMPGSTGGGLRYGADGLYDVGTIRHQMETYNRAGITGAPMLQALQNTVQRQQTLAEMGATTNFDRDALMLSTMEKTGVPMQQAGGIMKDLTGMRMSALERFQAPGKKMMAALLEASVYMRAGTVEDAGRILATESEAELIENAVRSGAMPDSALAFIGSRMTPSNQTSGTAFLRQMGDGATRGSATATGSTTADPDTMIIGQLESREGWSGVGASQNIAQMEAITRFRATLDSAAKHTIALADSLKALAASAGNAALGG